MWWAGPGRREALGRGDALRQVLMDGLSGLEPDPHQRPECSAGSRVQPQVPQAGVDKAQYVSQGQVGWGSGQGARPSETAESVRGCGGGRAADLACAAGPEALGSHSTLVSAHRLSGVLTSRTPSAAGRGDRCTGKSYSRNRAMYICKWPLWGQQKQQRTW